MSSRRHDNNLQHIVTQRKYVVSLTLAGLGVDFILRKLDHNDGEIVLNEERNPTLFFKLGEILNGEETLLLGRYDVFFLEYFDLTPLAPLSAIKQPILWKP